MGAGEAGSCCGMKKWAAQSLLFWLLSIAICFQKKLYPKLKKIEKRMSYLKSLEDELRAEMARNAVVRIKRGLSRAKSNSEGICREIARNVTGEESSNSYKSTSRSNKVSLASNGNRAEITSLTGLPPTISMVGYTAEAFRCFCSFAGISNMCKHWKKFLLTSTEQTWCSK